MWFVRDETAIRVENYAEEEKFLRGCRQISGAQNAASSVSHEGACAAPKLWVVSSVSIAERRMPLAHPRPWSFVSESICHDFPGVMRMPC
jgi:hypothetical protein